MYATIVNHQAKMERIVNHTYHGRHCWSRSSPTSGSTSASGSANLNLNPSPSPSPSPNPKPNPNPNQVGVLTMLTQLPESTHAALQQWASDRAQVRS